MFNVHITAETLADLKKKAGELYVELGGATICSDLANELYDASEALKNLPGPSNPFDFDSRPLEERAPTPAVESNDERPTEVTTTEVTAEQPAASSGLPADPRELDSKGFPWDVRIHAESRRKNKDGSWTSKRNLDAGFIASVEAELRGGTSRTSVATAPVAPPPPVPSVVPTQAAAQVPSVVSAAPVPVSDAAPVQVAPSFTQPVKESVVSLVPPNTAAPVAQPSMNPAPSAAPSYENIPVPEGVKPAHSLDTFKATLIKTLATLVKSGKIKQEYIAQLQAFFNVTDIWKVNDEQLKIMFDQFCAMGLITKVD